MSEKKKTLLVMTDLTLIVLASFTIALRVTIITTTARVRTVIVNTIARRHVIIIRMWWWIIQWWMRGFGFRGMGSPWV